MKIFIKIEVTEGTNYAKFWQKTKNGPNIYKERQQKLTKSFSLTKTEQKKYVMSTNDDYEILKKVKQLEKLKLNKEDKILVWLIKTQLEFEWRNYLIHALNQILKKYRKK